jgi:hypothetical protein
MCDLDHPCLAGPKNTNSGRARKGDLHCSFPLNILIVPSLAPIITVDGECLSCGGFSHGETIHFGSLESNTDCFDGLSLSPMGDGSDAIIIGSAHGGLLSPLRAMTGDFAEDFDTALNGEGRIDLPSPRKRGTGASPVHTTTTSWPESTLIAQAMTTILPRFLGEGRSILPSLHLSTPQPHHGQRAL